MGTAIAAACAVFLLYGGWLVLLELVMRARERNPIALPEILVTPQS
jgi:hypothetical protein